MLNKFIALGLLLGLIVGLVAAASGNAVLLAIADGSAPFGKLFINAIRMIVIPLVVTIVFASIARLGDIKTLGKIGGRTLGFYWLTLIPAIALGMGVMALGLRFVPDMTMPAADAVTVPNGLFYRFGSAQYFRCSGAGRYLASHRLHQPFRSGGRHAG